MGRIGQARNEKTPAKARVSSAQRQNRTADTGIFNPCADVAKTAGPLGKPQAGKAHSATCWPVACASGAPVTQPVFKTCCQRLQVRAVAAALGWLAAASAGCAAPAHDGTDGWGQQTALVPVVDWGGADASWDPDAGPVVVAPPDAGSSL